MRGSVALCWPTFSAADRTPAHNLQPPSSILYPSPAILYPPSRHLSSSISTSLAHIPQTSILHLLSPVLRPPASMLVHCGPSENRARTATCYRTARPACPPTFPLDELSACSRSVSVISLASHHFSPAPNVLCRLGVGGWLVICPLCLSATAKQRRETSAIRGAVRGSGHPYSTSLRESRSRAC